MLLWYKEKDDLRQKIRFGTATDEQKNRLAEMERFDELQQEESDASWRRRLASLTDEERANGVCPP